jgi:hypothetical protein
MLTLTKLPKINILFHNKNTNCTKIIKNQRIHYIIYMNEYYCLHCEFNNYVKRYDMY